MVVYRPVVIVITFMVLLALPQCKLREIVMPFVAWGFVVLVRPYCISPMDACRKSPSARSGCSTISGAAVAGVGTAVATINARSKRHPHYHDPYFKTDSPARPSAFAPGRAFLLSGGLPCAMR